MQCYNHQERPAVGICTGCNKGVCRECCVEVDGALSHKGECEEKVRIMRELLKRAHASYGKHSQAYKYTSLIYALFSLLIILVGFLFVTLSDSTASGVFLIAMGLVFAVGSLLYYRSGKRIASVQ